MKGSELVQLINRSDTLRKDFRGVYAKDTFSQLSSLLAGNYVLNTSVSTEPTGHWVVYSTSQSPSEISCFFDPLGKSPSAYNFLFPRAAESMLIFNDMAVQHGSSMSCGKFCLHFMFWKSQGMEMREIVTLYSSDKTINEQIVDEFVKRLLSGEV